MKWFKACAIGLAGVTLVLVFIRLLSPLPTLQNRSESRAYVDTQETPLGRAIGPGLVAHPGLSGILPLVEPVDAFAARAALAKTAARSIDAQYYIWHHDKTGSLLFNELRAAADRGVRVRLLLDDNNTSGLDPIIVALDAHPKIEVRLFNPFVIRQPRWIGFLTDFSRLNRRMHNKSFTVDNQVTVVGGRNVGDEYFGAGDGSLFVDMDVVAVGPVVPEVSSDFDRYWSSGSSYPAALIVPRATAFDRAQTISRLRTETETISRGYATRASDSHMITHLLTGRSPLDWGQVRMISDHPAKGIGPAKRDDLLFSKLTANMGSPKRSLDLVSGYFVPAEAGTRAITEMAKRGVQVTILTNAFEATDVPIVHAGYFKWRKPLLRAGARIFELRGATAAHRSGQDLAEVGGSGSHLGRGGSALHAKTILVDDKRLFIGSFNFDPRSANLNTELGFVIDDPALTARMHSALLLSAPERAYEVRLTEQGELYWVTQSGGVELKQVREPGTTLWQRWVLRFLSLLPIEWLL